MSSSVKLSFDPAGVEVDLSLYRSIIGSLLYLAASRSDIAFSVGVCAHFQAARKESYMTAIKRIIRYVNGTSDYGIWYLRESNDCLVRYLMLIGPSVLMIEKAHQEDVSISETIWCHGWARSKIQCHYWLLKWNTLLWVFVMLNSYGWRSFFMIMGFLETPCAFSMTIQAPLTYPRILFNIQSQSISKFDITSFVTWWKRK